MDKIYYEEYFDLERNHWWFRARKEIINSLLKKNVAGNNNQVLNVGAATGETSTWLSSYGKVTSVEYEKECCDFVKQKLNLDFIPASVTELPFAENKFELVTAFDVIEHVEDHHMAIAEMTRVCKPGGVIAITVPAFEFLWSKHDDINHHQRRYRMQELEKLFEKHRGKIIFKSYFNSILFLPVALTRILANIFPFIVNRKGSGSDFSYSGGRVSSFLFFRLMKSEKFWLVRGFSFPAGISLILLFRKEK